MGQLKIIKKERTKKTHLGLQNSKKPEESSSPTLCGRVCILVYPFMNISVIFVLQKLLVVTAAGSCTRMGWLYVDQVLVPRRTSGTALHAQAEYLKITAHISCWKHQPFDVWKFSNSYLCEGWKWLLELASPSHLDVILPLCSSLG